MDIQSNEFEVDQESTLNSFEVDTIGEILNISMGAAATAVSTMLDKEVVITIPKVECIKLEDFDYKNLEPADGVKIEYIEGLSGYNFMVMRRRDIRIIVSVLMGEEIEDGDEELDEMHSSALNEIMNQMMGASSTALSEFFGKTINISPPEQFDTSNINNIINSIECDGNVVKVTFIFKVEDMIDSEFCTVFPVKFTKELIAMAIGESEEKVGEQQAEEVSVDQQFVVDAANIMREEQISRVNNNVHLNDVSLNKKDQETPKIQQNEVVNVTPIELPSFDKQKNAVVGANNGKMDLIMDVPLSVTIEVGRAKKSIREIIEMGKSTVVELDKQAGDAVDVIVNGKLLARGDVVTVDDNYGIRITEIISSKEMLNII